MKYLWKIIKFEITNAEFCRECGEEGSVVVIDGVCYCQECDAEYLCNS